MHPEVHSVCIRLYECLVAKRTYIWALTGVNALVGPQDRTCHEPLVAVRAGVRPLPAVTSHMIFDYSPGTEFLITNFASEGHDFNARVNAVMPLQVISPFKWPLTLSALEQPHRGVSIKMVIREGGTGCRSLFTFQLRLYGDVGSAS